MKKIDLLREQFNKIEELKKFAFTLATKEVQEQRIALCKSCEHYNTTLHICNMCKCFVDAKTKLAGQSCPMKKWESTL